MDFPLSGPNMKINRSGEFEATAVGVDDDGELIVLKDNGEKTAVFSGEVSVRGVY